MSLPRVQLVARQFRAPSVATLAALQNALSSFRISSPSATVETKRNASHQAQGRANGAKDGPGKRLGAKKTAGQYVVPGNIIFKQRGTHWFPGDGCFMGRDHTIHAEVPGFVTYYRDPARHPKRQFIGVVFERQNKLPQPPNAVRRRKLGMLAYRMPEAAKAAVQQATPELNEAAAPAPTTLTRASAHATFTYEQPTPGAAPTAVTVRSMRGPIGKSKEGELVDTKLKLTSGYQWRQTNAEIGRAAEQRKVAQEVRPFDRSDRFLAWRKRNARIKRSAEKRALARGGKGKSRKK